MYRQKFFDRVARVEDLELNIDTWESWARTEITKKHPEIESLSDSIARANSRALYLNKILAAQDRYKNLVGARNSNLAMAQMYGLAALLEEVMDDDPGTARPSDPAAGNGDHGPGSKGRGQHTDQAA